MQGYTIDLFKQAIYLIIMTSMPMLLVALIVGLIISVFQATTQIQEQTLSFVPKILAVFLVMIYVSPWILTKLVEFTREILESIVTKI